MVSNRQSKPDFRDSLRRIATQHQKGTGGIRIALALTRALDEVVLRSFHSLPPSVQPTVALVALGGYGRKELCFGSDTDIMLLIPGSKNSDAPATAQQLLHRLLDQGLDIGHSVRTVKDCLALRSSDIEAWVSLVESRFLSGNRNLFLEFRKNLEAQIDRGNHAALVRDLVERMELRHQKYGDSTKLLEPNIKNSAGGLRDLHSVLWLFLATGTIRIPATLSPNATALTTMLSSPALRSHSTRIQLSEARQAFDYLLRTRNAMHLQSGGLHDSLEFAFQRTLAENLGYAATPTRSSVERFMQEYFVASRHVAQFARRSTAAIQRTLLPKKKLREQKLDPRFALRAGQVVPLSGSVLYKNEYFLSACSYILSHTARFSSELEDVMARHAHRLGQIRSKTEAALFRSLFNQPAGVGHLLQRLSEYGILERWIPEWKAMVAFFQHNQYHFYTADEHTLRVIQNAEELATQKGSFADTYRSLPRKDTLVLACLLHDIAKPQRVGDHELTGATMASTILRRLHCDDISADVQFLIRHHLLMEQTAFRRNLSDPQTILAFTRQFWNPALLDYLYVLTYADLSAVNRNVWTDWKGMLLYELYREAKEILDRKLTSEQVHSSALAQHQDTLSTVVEKLSQSIPADNARSHLEAVSSPAYLAAFEPEEIAEHIRHISRGEVVSTIMRQAGEVTELTIVTRDAPSVLSKCCGVFSANDANILDANIFTRNDGIVIDKFRVMDFVSRSALNETQCAKIQRELNDVIMGAIGIDRLLERHRMKWRRLTRLLGPPSRSAVEFEDHPQYTIIDVFAADRLGFLYKITEAISQLNLDISFAKIATRADGIVDSFYVLDRSGRKILTIKQKDEIRATLLAAIQSVTDSELTAKL